MNNLSEAIKTARLKAGLTQRELAEKIGLKPLSIAQAEWGRRNVSISLLVKIAEALETSFNIDSKSLDEVVNPNGIEDKDDETTMKE